MGDDDPPGAVDPEVLSQVADLADVVRDQPTLTGALGRLAELTVEQVSGADGAGVSVLLEDAPTLVVGSAPFVDAVEALQQGLREGPSLTAATGRHPVVVGAIGSDPRWPAFDPDAGRLGIGSLVALPLVVDGGICGVLTLYAVAENAFTPAVVATAVRYAERLAVAVARARLLGASRTFADEIAEVLSVRATVDTAVGLLVQRNGIDEEQALAHLRAIAEIQQRTPLAIARQILADAAIWGSGADSTAADAPADAAADGETLESEPRAERRRGIVVDRSQGADPSSADPVVAGAGSPLRICSDVA